MPIMIAALNIEALFRSFPGSIAQGLLWGIMAVGVFITFRLLDFADLTVDGSLAVGGAVSVMLVRNGIHPALSLIFAFLAGMLAGLVTGLLHTQLGIPGILASILTQISLYSINLNIMGKSNQPINVDQYPLVVSLRYVSAEPRVKGIFFVGLIVFCVLLCTVVYNFFGTEIGASIRAVGANPIMAAAEGINVSRMKVIALMLSNGLVGLSGGLYSQFQGAADVNMGRGAIVIGLAAVIIGEVIFGKLAAKSNYTFYITLLSVLVGAVIYYLVIAFVLWLKFPPDDMKLFSAIVVAVFLAIPYINEKRLAKGRKVKV